MPGPGEPLWLDDDRAWAMALLLVEEETCRGCGNPLSESTSPDLEFQWTPEVLRCHACAAGSRHAEQWQKAGGDQHGLNIHVHREEAHRD